MYLNECIGKFHNENILEWKCFSRPCLICLMFVFVWIGCLLGENCFDSKMSGIDLGVIPEWCLSHSAICKYHLQVEKISAMHWTSEREKSLQQSWIRVYFRAGAHPIKELRNRTSERRKSLWQSLVSERRRSRHGGYRFPQENQEKPMGQSALTLPRWGTSRLGAYRHNSPSGANPISGGSGFCPKWGNPTLGAERLQKIVRMHMQSCIETSEISVRYKRGQNKLYELGCRFMKLVRQGIIQTRKSS